jgi:hypothetical protein
MVAVFYSIFYEKKNILKDPLENWADSGQVRTCDTNQPPEKSKQYITFCDICQGVGTRGKKSYSVKSVT